MNFSLPPRTGDEDRKAKQRQRNDENQREKRKKENAATEWEMLTQLLDVGAGKAPGPPAQNLAAGEA